jgi:hypothetical protein
MGVTMNRTVFSIVGLVGSGALIGLSVGAGFAGRTAEVRGADAEKVTALRKERRDALLEASSAAEQNYKVERTDFATVRRLKTELLDAQLDLAPDHDARVAIRKRFVEQFREIEQSIAAQAAVGLVGGGRTELFESKAARLKSEIDLALELADDKRSE